MCAIPDDDDDDSELSSEDINRVDDDTQWEDARVLDGLLAGKPLDVFKISLRDMPSTGHQRQLGRDGSRLLDEHGYIQAGRGKSFNTRGAGIGRAPGV